MTSRNSQFWFLLLLLIAVQAVSRYAGAPVPGLSTDDWRILGDFKELQSFGDVLATFWRWPDRPLGCWSIYIPFYVFRDQAAPYIALSLVYYSAFLIFVFLLAEELSQSRFVAFATTLLMGLFPNLTESYQWNTMVVYGHCLATYTASAWLWLRFSRTGRRRDLVLSTLCFLLALFTYEFGIGLPLIFLAALPPSRWRKALPSLLPFAACMALYLGWKFTDGFGTARDLLFPIRALELSPWLIAHNAKQVVSWWLGSNMGTTLLNGWTAFALLTPWQQRGLILLNLVMLAAAGTALVRLHRKSVDASPPLLLPGLFALGWIAVTHGINLVSWTAPRLTILPAVGVALVLALILSRFQPRTWMPVLSVLAFLAMTANQGTSKSWRDASVFQTRIYEHLEQDRAAWENAEILLIDTTSLRQRLTPGLLTPPGDRDVVWAYYKNASTIRGLAIKGMIRQIKDTEPYPLPMLDAEHGATREGGALYWHGWYQPDEHHETPLDRVYILDAFAVGSSPR